MNKLLSFIVVFVLFQTGNAQTVQETFKLASSKFHDTDYRGAVEDYTKVINENAELVAESYNFRALSKHQLGQKESALEDYNKAIEITPDYEIAYNNRGVLKYDMGDRVGAQEDFLAALDFDKRYATAFNNLAIVQFENGQNKSAMRNYDKALKISPDYPQAHNNRGVALDSEDLMDDALDDYDKAVELNPNYGLAYYNRGLARYATGDTKGGCEDLNLARELGIAQAAEKIELFCNGAQGEETQTNEEGEPAYPHFIPGYKPKNLNADEEGEDSGSYDEEREYREKEAEIGARDAERERLRREKIKRRQERRKMIREEYERETEEEELREKGLNEEPPVEVPAKEEE